MKNPILNSPEIKGKFDALPNDSKQALKHFCKWLYEHSRDKAEDSWRRSKAPMAVYWKAVAAWSYHISRLIKIQPDTRKDHMCSCIRGWRSGPSGYFECTDCDYWLDPYREADLGADHSYDYKEADRINEYEMWGPAGRPDVRRVL